MKINRFFGDGRHDLEMTFDTAVTFEREQRKSLYATMTALLDGDFRMADIAVIVRLGLIGAGMDELTAFEKVETHIRNRPLAQAANLARDILEAAYFETDVVREEADRVFGAE